ncbi:VOC family protein [Tabrizicola piscis]|uniref:VOC family protein n=1 Tax=Tabrizicola piscis TaxID=2494374 RepID=A0A3S8U2V4_9RHOB|nr:VOC family protein [Tabrizicola piscis]AZL57895.1 VOC family protein [Tabrizicola piscis]
MLVPELTVPSPDRAAALLAGVFGFAPEAGLMRRGSQAVHLVAGQPQGHGRIDHISLTVPDIDDSLAALMAAGASLDATVTPNGAEMIPEFWGDGLRFVYLSGPETARIELCQRITGAAPGVGHDHIGIPCHDLPAMQAFFEAQGARLTAAVDLTRPEGMIPVRFLAYAGGMIELYQPAQATRAAHGLWSRLRVPGLAAALDGPEGLILAPL